MKPKPWSYSALDTFKNCPRQYEAKYVLKNVTEEKTPEIIWGEKVHKHFEDRQDSGVALPEDLQQHEEYMQSLEALPGTHFVEQKIALDTKLAPTQFFGKDVFYRGVIDYIKVHEREAKIIDYKTGKPHTKFAQLKLFALHTFTMYPDVSRIDAGFYWTKTKSETMQGYDRSQVKSLWKEFIPDLKQYKEAYQTDTWQPRQSGLCHGWCPVKDCEFWKPKRNR